MSGDWEAVGPSHRRRRGLGPLVVAGLLVALGVAVVSLPPSGEPEDSGPSDETGDETSDDLTVVPDAPDAPDWPDGTADDPDRPEPTASPEPVRRAGRDAPVGSWRSLPIDERIAPRADPVMVWTGQDVLVWGGRDNEGWRADGGLYDPRSDHWRPLPEVPARATSATSGTWVDGHLVVLGADDGEGDAAHGLLSPEGGWTPAVAAPDEHWRWSSATRWGDRVVVAGRDSAGHPGFLGGTAFAAYDPSADEWEALGRAPLAMLHSMASAGEHLIAVGHYSPDADRLAATALDPDSGSWSAPDFAPISGNWTPRVSADPERDRVLVVGAAHERGLTHVAATWSVEDGWTVLHDPPRGLSRAGPQAFPTFAGTVVWTPGDPGASHLLSEDDGVGERPGRWRRLATPPDAVGREARAVWTGQELVVAGGRGDRGATGQAALWRRGRASGSGLPPADARRVDGEWTQLPVDDAGVRRDPAVAAEGDTVAVWGGRGSHGWRADGVLVDVSSQVADPIPEAPVGARSAAVAVIAGDELIVWGGSDGGADWADGAAFDLTAGTWRRLPEAPLAAASYAAATADGDTIVVAAGNAAARYDPESDRWERLPDPPGDAPGALVRTRDTVLLAGADGTAARWDNGEWTQLSDHGFEADVAAVETPEGILVWSGERGAVYSRASDRWLPTAPPWASGPARAVAALPEGVVVWGGARIGDTMGGRLGAAMVDPASRRWSVLPDPPSGVSMDAMVSVDNRLLGWSSEGTLVGFEPSPDR